MIIAALAACALNLTGCERLSDEVFGARVHAYLMAHPEVIEEAAIKLEQTKMRQAGEAQSTAIARNRQAIERDKRDYVANPNGKITVTEFFDYRCGYCKTAAPEIIRMIAENPDVRFVFKEFPIFGGDSDQAAALALAAHREGRYLTLHQAFYAPSKLTPEAMDQAIAASGLNATKLKATARSAETAQHLADNQKLARSLRIDGTPAFVIGDRVVSGADFAAINAEIARLRGS